MTDNLATLSVAVAELCTRAAAAILDVYGRSDVGVESKDDRSPLTAADLASNRTITAGLAALTPDIPVLSEESSKIPWSQRERWRRYWLVDPLDGTREFLKRNGEFTVNVALIEDGRPVLGVVQTPVTGELARAWRGGGAWLATGGAAAVPMKTRRRATPLVVTGSRSHSSPREAELLGRLGSSAAMPMGSSLKFLRIAAGEADLYIRLGPTSEWDTAAAQFVLEEAGGAVLGFTGQPLLYNQKESLLNPGFFAIGDRTADWSVLLAD